MTITPVLIVADAEHTIAQCLKSLEGFGEVVVYLNNTTDATKSICEDFPNVKVIEGEFTNYSETRNKGASYASNDWILRIDADEWLDDKAIYTLSSWKPQKVNSIGTMVLHNIFMGRRMRGGHMRPSPKLCLYNRTACRFEKPVHETLVCTNPTFIALEGSILHQVAITSKKVDLYTSLEDRQRRALPLALVGSVFAFVRSYVFQLGFVDGKAGICCALAYFRYHLAKYRRRKDDNT